MRSPGPPLWRVALLYTAVTVVLAYPLSVRPADHVLSAAPDTDYSLWALSWDVHALARHPLSVFDANIYHPERRTLAYSENLIGSAPLAAPVLWSTGNAVLAMNLVVLLATVLSGLGAYVLARRLGIGTDGALLCGVIFAFTPPRFLRLDQFHLATTQWIPFGLASLHAYLESRRRRDAVLAASFFTLQALSSGHGAVFLSLAMMIVVSCRIALRGWRSIPGTMGGLAIAAAPLVPAAIAFWPYVMVQREMGLRRSLEDWAVPWTSFFASSSHVDSFLASLVPSWHINDVAGPHLFPGLLPIVLAAAALWAGRAERAPRAGPTRPARPARQAGAVVLAAVLESVALAAAAAGAYVAATGATRIKLGGVTVMTIRQPWRIWTIAFAAVALRVAVGPRACQLMRSLVVAGRRLGTWRAAHRDDPRVAYSAITVLSLWLAVGPPVGVWPAVYWLPGLDFIRAPSRFTMLAVLGLAVLAGIGYERLTSRLAPRRRQAVAAAAIALLVVEFAAVPFSLEPYRVEIPAIERWLASQPAPFVVAEVPVGNPRNYVQWEQREATYMLHSTAHWQKTVHGYSGFRSELHQNLFAELAEFPSEQSLEHLHELGVTDLVVHADLYPPGDWPRVEQRIAAFGDWLTLRHVEGDGRVYALGRTR